MFNSYFNEELIRSLERDSEFTLKRYVELMPLDKNGKGRFWNGHNGGHEDSADAIAMQADGTVVLLDAGGICTVNPLRIAERSSNPLPVVLLTEACGGNFIPDCNGTATIDWQKSIERYNKSGYSAQKMLVAVYSFDEKSNERIDVAANAALFIIPNSVGPVEKFASYLQPKMRRFAADILEANGIPYEDINDEMMVETWIVSELDLGSENLADHGFTVEIGGEKRRFRLPSRYLPVRLFEGA